MNRGSASWRLAAMMGLASGSLYGGVVLVDGAALGGATRSVLTAGALQFALSGAKTCGTYLLVRGAQERSRTLWGKVAASYGLIPVTVGIYTLGHTLAGTEDVSSKMAKLTAIMFAYYSVLLALHVRTVAKRRCQGRRIGSHSPP